MNHPGNPLITRLLAHAAQVKAARARTGSGDHGDGFTVAELADLLGVSPDLLYSAVECGRLESFRPRGRSVEAARRANPMIKSISLRSALCYVIDSIDGLTDEALAEAIIKLLPTLGRDELLTRIAARITDIRARRGVLDNAAVLAALGADAGLTPKPNGHARTFRVLPPPDELQPDLFERTA